MRDRAARLGPELFLLDRAFDEVMDRLAAIRRPIDDLLLVGCASSDWLTPLKRRHHTVEVVEPGALLARAAGVAPQLEVAAKIGEHRFDAAIAIGTLDTVNNLPLALRRIMSSMRPGSPLLGALAGGNSLPALRSALIEGERTGGSIRQRVHPRIDAPTLAGLLGRAGFGQSVGDVERVTLRYASMAALVRDLRAMGATNQLTSIAPISRAAAARAEAAFQAAAIAGKTAETIEILHFTGWVP